MANPHPSKSWKPGQSGNPKGGPKKDDSWAGMIRKAQEADVDGKTKKEKIVNYLLDYCINQADDPDGGNIHAAIKAVQFLSDRVDGKPAQAVQMTGADDGPVKIQVDFVGGEGE